MIIPAEVRRALGFEDGDEVILHVDEDGLRISTPAQAISRAQSLVRQYVSEGSDLSGELMADRRAEVEAEAARDGEDS
jgi:AbrB family looped-hinge helix DNA binding protein